MTNSLIDWIDTHPAGLPAAQRGDALVRGQCRHFSALEPLPHNIPECLEFGVVLRGRVRLSFPAGEFVLDSGEAWFSPKGEPRTGEILDAPCSLLVLEMDPTLPESGRFPEAPNIDLAAPFNAQVRNRPRQDPKDRARLVEWARRTANALNGDGEVEAVRLRLLAYEGLLLACGSWQAPVRIAKSARERLTPALQMVQSQRGPVRTADAARACGIGRSRFDRLFQEFMHQTFGQFALLHRLGGAAADLRQTDLPLKAVAANWGFSDPSHFHRRFVQHYGQTPLTYRQCEGRRIA